MSSSDWSLPLPLLYNVTFSVLMWERLKRLVVTLKSLMLISGLQALEGIMKTWEETSLDITPYKDKGHHKLR